MVFVNFNLQRVGGSVDIESLRCVSKKYKFSLPVSTVLMTVRLTTPLPVLFDFGRAASAGPVKARSENITISRQSSSTPAHSQTFTAGELPYSVPEIKI